MTNKNNKTKEKIQKLTFLLIKETITSFEDALKSPNTLRRRELKDSLPYSGVFFYEAPQQRKPPWQTFVSPALSSRLDGLHNTTASAVLLVRASERILAITFGFGRNLLKLDCHELQFGLKVVLNRINPNKIRSLDARTYEDLVVTTRKQTSRSSEVNTFGLDVAKDLLRAVAGEPNDSTFAKRVSGTDSLTIAASVNVSGLGKKCDQILEAYNDDKYKKHFQWVDHLSEVRDKGMLSRLNDELVSALRQRNIDKLHLAPAESIDWHNVEKLRIGGAGSRVFDELDIERYWEALSDPSTLTLDMLRRNQVKVQWTTSSNFYALWSVYNCIVWETTLAGDLYALYDGKWFQVERSFADRVKKFIRDLPEPRKLLPDAIATEKEDEYNKRIAEADPELVCLDQKLIRPTDTTSPIEFCDLLSKQKQLIHVKRKTRSATLSHLFSQGTVSATAFMQDEGVRMQIREILKKNGGADFIEIIPGRRPPSSDYEIVYAIISKKAEKGGASLPFFSQLNLMQHAKQLTGAGFNVALQLIKLEKKART